MSAHAIFSRLIGLSLSVVGALSLFVLAAQGFGLDTTSSSALVAHSYDGTVQFIFRPANSVASDALDSLNVAAGAILSVRAYWNHIFILLWLYFGASALNALRLGLFRGAAFRLVWGTVISFPTSIAASTVPLDNRVSSHIALSFMIGVFAYGVGLAAYLATTERHKRATGDPVPWGWSFWYHLAPPFRMSFLAVLLLAVGDWTVTQGLFPRGVHFGLSALIGTMLLLGAYWVFHGFRTARAGDVRLGYTVLNAVGGAIALFVLVAVMGTLGL